MMKKYIANRFKEVSLVSLIVIAIVSFILITIDAVKIYRTPYTSLSWQASYILGIIRYGPILLVNIIVFLFFRMKEKKGL